MKTCTPRARTEIAAETSGAGCTVAVSQAHGDPGGWRIEVYAHLGEYRELVASLTLPPRAGLAADRVIFVGSAPGASGWSALVLSPTSTGANKDLRVGVYCSDCCTPPTLTAPLQL